MNKNCILSFFVAVSANLLPLTKKVPTMSSTAMYSPSSEFLSSVVSRHFLRQIRSPSKCSFTPSKLRFFGLRKPKTTSFYSTSRRQVSGQSTSANKKVSTMSSTAKYSPSSEFLSSVVSRHFLRQICSPSKCSFTPSKLRFFGLRKPKTTSVYSTNKQNWDDYFLVIPLAEAILMLPCYR